MKRLQIVLIEPMVYPVHPQNLPCAANQYKQIVRGVQAPRVRTRLEPVVVMCVPAEFFLKVGVRNGYQVPGALLDGPSEEVDGAKFGRHPVDVPTRRDHTCALIKMRNDP